MLFVSKDQNLTKAHVRWLEARLINEIHKSKRAEIMNAKGAIGGKLPESDEADMETYLDNVRLLLPTLGVNVFTTAEPGGTSAVPKNALRLELAWEDARARCFVNEGQFVIEAGSTARVKEVESLGAWSRAARKVMREQGVLVPYSVRQSIAAEVHPGLRVRLALRRGGRHRRDGAQRTGRVEGEGQGDVLQGVGGVEGHRAGRGRG